MVFSIVDIVEILTEQKDYQGARNYWKVLKHRLLKEGNETVTNCNRLKMLSADGKMRLTDVANTKDIFRNEKSHNTLTDYIKNNPYNWCKNTLNQ